MRMKTIVIIAILIAIFASLSGCVSDPKSTTAPIINPTTKTGDGGSNPSGSGGSFGETKISDDISVSGFRAADRVKKTVKATNRKTDYDWMESGYAYYSLNNIALTLDIVSDLNRDKIENLIINYKGNTVNNFRIIKGSSSTYIKADVTPAKGNSLRIQFDTNGFKKLPIGGENHIFVRSSPGKTLDEKTELTISTVENKDWDQTKALFLKIILTN